jgi:hypothetical protein
MLDFWHQLWLLGTEQRPLQESIAQLQLTIVAEDYRVLPF